MSYLCYLCLFAYSGVQHMILCFSWFCVSYIASFSGLSIFSSPGPRELLPSLFVCPVIPTSNQDGHQAKNRKKGG